MRSGWTASATTINSLPLTCLSLILNFVPVSELHAQGPTEPRNRRVDWTLIDKTPATLPFSSVLIMKLWSESKVSIRRVSIAQEYPKVDYQGLAATWDATSVHLFKQLDTADILLAGRSAAGKGALALLRDSATGFAQVGSLYEDAGARFVGVAYSGKKARVYLLDSWKKRIVYASLSVGASALPTQWTTLITDQTLPALGSANELGLELYVDGDEPKLGLISLGNDRVSQYWIKDAANGVQVTLMELGTGDVAKIVTQPLLIDSPTVRVEAKPGLQVVVTDLFDGVPLGTGVMPPSGALDVLVPPVAWGQILGAGLLAGPVGPPYLFPYQSWGLAEALDNNLSIATIGEVEAATAWVDQPHFRATLSLDWQQAPQAPASYGATLLVGSEQGLVPIGGGQYALLGVGTVAFPTTVHLDATMMPKGIGVLDLPIPNDPMLGGTVTLLQWVVSKTPTEAKISNVAAFFIYPTEFDPEQVPQGMQASKSTSGTSRTQARRRPESVFVQSARYKWLVTKNKGVLMDKGVRASLRKLLRRK